MTSESSPDPIPRGESTDTPPSPAGRPLGIVVGHGALAEGLVSAVRCITGERADCLLPLSNEGLSPDELCARMDELAAGRPTVVFADLEFGSCASAAQICCRNGPGRASVSGVNLPMLLDFACSVSADPESAASKVAERGRDAIAIRRGT